MKKIKRNPEIAWREEEEMRNKVEEILKQGGETEEASKKGTVTLVYSGAMHQLNLLGGEIWKLCDGTRTEEEIGEELLKTFDVERDILLKDLKEFILDLQNKKWLFYE